MIILFFTLLLASSAGAGEWESLSDYDKCIPKRPNCVSMALPDIQRFPQSRMECQQL